MVSIRACCLNFIEILISIASALLFTIYMQQLHEVRLWFSNIRDVEREISLRTEAGLYYSYYKDAVSLEKGFFEFIDGLIHDIRTEYPREINVIERFNIYQEIILAYMYKFLIKFKLLPVYLQQPIIFYVYSCFLISGLAIMMLQLLTARVTKCRFLGILVFAWMTANLDDSTRVFLTVNMRENFALPCFWIQNIFVIAILEETCFATHSMKLFNRTMLTLTTLLFALLWQFGQFILLLQSISVFMVHMINPSLSCKNINSIFKWQTIGYILSIIAQFMQPMAMLSTLLPLNIAVIIANRLTRITDNKRLRNISATILKVIFVVCVTLAIKQLYVSVSGVRADAHIWTFVRAKAGILSRGAVPFETLLYICHGAFHYLDKEFFERTSKTGCFPLYAVAIVIIVIYCIFRLYGQVFGRKFDESEVFKSIDIGSLYFTIQSLCCGIIAIFTLRMKYLWFPQMVVLSAWLLSRFSIFIGQIGMKLLIFSIAIALLSNHYHIYKAQMADEQEFYDPDTVELMEWIKMETPLNSTWSGSMQLMAGIKACTNRRLANHPHFEDEWLRRRTQQLYQIYGRKPINEVFGVLRNESVDYIILEDSICMAPSNGCSINDLIDISNGEAIDSDEGSASPNAFRFCERMRVEDDETTKYFRLVFMNRTFRVYEILGPDW